MDKAHQIQLSNTTRADRYPKVFQTVVEAVTAAGIVRPRVLSYGCSNGAEPYTLVSKYFLESEVVGVDVSAEVLAEARANYGTHSQLRFETSSEEMLTQLGLFDVVFAMSVLCVWPHSRNLDNIAKLFAFKSFEGQVALLDRVVRPGGFLVIYNASYSFLQSAISAGYDLILHPRIATSGFVKRFDKTGAHVEGLDTTDCIYRKRDTLTKDATRLVIRSAGLRQMGVILRNLR